jgi:D-glutamate cyclase
MKIEQLISDIESLIRRDPARRGLIGADGNGPGMGELAVATQLFLEKPSGVGLITGFFVRKAVLDESATDDHPAEPDCLAGHAETDGPPGTVVLADVLAGLGIPVTLITDELCEPVVRLTCCAGSSHKIQILASPIEKRGSANWRADILKRGLFQNISHLVAIERVGPGYTTVPHQNSDIDDRASDNRQREQGTSWKPGHCCNMRGESIDAFSADLHLLIEAAATRNSKLQVVGIGDGGNEIGMGRFSWNELRARLPGPNADRVPCRVSADATVVAGVSNWGAYALAATIAVLHDRVDLLERHTAASQQEVIETVVREAGAVDGVTRRNEPTVDGLPFLTQIQPWIAIRERLGLKP